MRRALLAMALAGVVAIAAGFSPFEAEEPHVREGNERVAAGHPEAALPEYDAAERTAGARAELEYDRGVALQKLGRSAEARDAFRRALERGAGALTSRAQQNLGTALLATGDRDGAIAAFIDALRSDPKNDDARFDLEVLLRRKQAEQERARRQRAEGSQAAAPAGQAQTQAGGPGERPGERERAQDPQVARGEPARPAPSAARDPGGDPGPGRDAGAARLSREDAARILDAFRARERSLPAPRAERRAEGAADADRDW